jgi:Inosine-uridine preferring nucleoside hydrolase
VNGSAALAFPAALLVPVLALGAWRGPSDDDGETSYELAYAGAVSDPVPVVVDTDLGGDDLAALALLLRHPEVRVEAITIAGTGLVGCDPGVDVVADLLTALDEEPVPVACGREDAGPGALSMPVAWRETAARGSGIPRAGSTLEPSRLAAPQLIGRLASRKPGLVVVELGPMTNLADLADTSPGAFHHLAGIRAMGGSLEGPVVVGAAEWNAAADPASFDTVLAAGVPLTVVPEDAVPDGTPLQLSAPLVRDVAAAVDYPRWWDLATAASLVSNASGTIRPGAWRLDPAAPGRLVRTGPGGVDVVVELDEGYLEEEYASVFVPAG